jgi:flagellar basal body-associated protein FliL
VVPQTSAEQVISKKESELRRSLAVYFSTQSVAELANFVADIGTL